MAPALPRYTLRQQPELEAEHQQRQQQAQQQQQRQDHQQAVMKAAEQQESVVRAAEQELAMRAAERQRQQQQETLEDSLRTGGPTAVATALCLPAGPPAGAGSTLVHMCLHKEATASCTSWSSLQRG